MITIHTYDVGNHTHKVEPLNDFDKRAGFCEKFYYYTGLQNIDEMKKVATVLQTRLKAFEDEKRVVQAQPNGSLEVLREQYYQIYEKWPKNLTGKSEIINLHAGIAGNHAHLISAQGALNCLGRKICQFIQKIFGWMKTKWEKQIASLNDKIDEGLNDVKRELEIGKISLKAGDPVSVRAEMLADEDHCLSGDMKISLIANPTSSQWVNAGFMVVKQEENAKDLIVQIPPDQSAEIIDILVEIAKEMCLDDGLKGVVDTFGHRLDAAKFKIEKPILYKD